MESALHPYSRLITVEYGCTPWPGNTLTVIIPIDTTHELTNIKAKFDKTLYNVNMPDIKRIRCYAKYVDDVETIFLKFSEHHDKQHDRST